MVRLISAREFTSKVEEDSIISLQFKRPNCRKRERGLEREKEKEERESAREREET